MKERYTPRLRHWAVVVNCICVALIPLAGVAQTTYFAQDFSGTGPFLGAPPNSGQFDTFITTKPNSTITFGPGYMQMERVAPGPEGGGLARAVRSTAFSPAPQTLYYQVTMDVLEINQAAPNAIYFYVGENLSPTNSSFPENSSLFARFSVHFEASGSGFVYRVRDFNSSTPSIPFTGSVTITWVLNNSPDNQIYKMPENAPVASETVLAGKYDLWVNGTKYFSAKSSESPFSSSKLTNFEIRFRDGLGKVRFTNLRLRDIDMILPSEELSFNGRGAGSMVELEWKTLFERDCKEFEIQRSQNLMEFEPIGVEPAVGQSDSPIRYFYSDRAPMPGINYYRLKKLDRDGKVQYSRVVDVVFDSGYPFVEISPNPALPNLIRLRTFMVDPRRLRLVNLLGQDIPVRTLVYDAGGWTELIPFYPLASGIYLVILEQEGSYQYRRVVVN